MHDIFLSYKSEDRGRARVLASALEREGCSVWWDREIPPGEKFDQFIKTRLDSARCVVVLWSKASAASDWVLEEASEGLRRKILVPALIEDVEIPLGFRRVQAANLVGWKGEDSNPDFRLLLSSVKALLGSAQQDDAAIVETGKLEKNDGGNAPTAWQWLLAGVVLLLSTFFYVLLVGSTCSNPDMMVILSVAGFLVTAMLVFKKRRFSFLWLLAPVVIFLAGLPYGHRYGMITRSRLFGLPVGANCQFMGDSYLVLAGTLAVLLGTNYVIIRLRSKSPARSSTKP